MSFSIDPFIVACQLILSYLPTATAHSFRKTHVLRCQPSTRPCATRLGNFVRALMATEWKKLLAPVWRRGHAVALRLQLVPPQVFGRSRIIHMHTVVVFGTGTLGFGFYPVALFYHRDANPPTPTSRTGLNQERIMDNNFSYNNEYTNINT